MISVKQALLLSRGKALYEGPKLTIEFFGDDVLQIIFIRCKLLVNINHIDKFRIEITEELKTNGKIGTKLGNYRYQEDGVNNLSWALSQRIQGTASLILKKAIISVIEGNPEIDFLIPMHDAALFQVDGSKRLELESVIKECFLSTFKEECPLITSPKVKIHEFHL